MSSLTIKSLYDQGQRQFPMRGGGISPIIEYVPEDEYGHVWQCVHLNSHSMHLKDYWYEKGNHLALQMNMTTSLDLLPQPLPDLEVENARLRNEAAKIIGAFEPIAAHIDNPDRDVHFCMFKGIISEIIAKDMIKALSQAIRGV